MRKQVECILNKSAKAIIEKTESIKVVISTSKHKKKDRFRTVFFLSNPKDWYGISPQVSM